MVSPGFSVHFGRRSSPPWSGLEFHIAGRHEGVRGPLELQLGPSVRSRARARQYVRAVGRGVGEELCLFGGTVTSANGIGSRSVGSRESVWISAVRWLTR